jgi:uncharacterized protein
VSDANPDGSDLEADLIRSLAQSRPDLIDLAALTTLAIHTEPFLLRRLRTHFLPTTDASLEADLAFSDLVTSQGAFAEIDPAFLPALRTHLVTHRPSWISKARDLISAAHKDLSHALQVEEELIFLAVCQPPDWESKASELLARAAKAAESRPEIVQWALRSTQELPSQIRRTDGFWLLADRTGHAAGERPALGPMPARNFRSLANILALAPRQIDAGAKRDNGDLIITIPPAQAEYVFAVPETLPVTLEVDTQSKTEQIALDITANTATSRIDDVGYEPVQIRTLDGNNYVVPKKEAPSSGERVFENSRDRHLFGPGPKWILSLDGGGIRAALTVAFLERIEKLLTDRDGSDVRLCDYFDLIGGTSTGAILAAALALGFKVEQVKDLFIRLAPSAFKGSLWRIPILQAKFDASGLRQQIELVVGDRTLASSDLLTGLCVVTKRIDTGTPWFAINNPRSPFWSSTSATRPEVDHNVFIGADKLRLAKVLRASTAAPHFFDPETIQLTEEGPAAVFVDGGVTPHNNPAMALFQIATARAQGLSWRRGPQNLGIISLGTGSYRPRLSYQNLGFARFTKLAFHSLISVMNDLEVLVLTQMQHLGECPSPWVINSEVGTLADVAPPGGKMFRFLRYDVRLEKDWLARELNVTVDDDMLERLRGMDDPSLVDKLYEIGSVAAEKQIKSDHFNDRLTRVLDS